MHIIRREVDLEELTNKNSYFLFGPRGTGKSFSIRQTFKDKNVNYINLLDSKTFLLLQRNPSELKTFISHPLIIIDEIQRIPELLNQVHLLIEEQKLRFLLTGSSARKLKREGVNLLAGRAYIAQLLSLTWKELSEAGIFSLETYLTLGGLPKAYVEKEGFDYLYAYVDTYLKEEIQAEALVRTLPNYSRFLETAAFMNGELINYTKIASDAQLAPNTVRDYFQILQDTLIAYLVPPWKKSRKRKAIQTTKFYFSDIGVSHALRNIEHLDRNSDLFGKAFEHFIANELRAYLSYTNKRIALTYWRSTSYFEVDFVVADQLAIEVKTSTKPNERDHKGLQAIAEEKDWKHLLLVSQDTQPRNFSSGVQQIYWQDFLTKLWAGQYI